MSLSEGCLDQKKCRKATGSLPAISSPVLARFSLLQPAFLQILLNPGWVLSCTFRPLARTFSFPVAPPSTRQYPAVLCSWRPGPSVAAGPGRHEGRISGPTPNGFPDRPARTDAWNQCNWHACARGRNVSHGTTGQRDHSITRSLDHSITRSFDHRIGSKE